MCKLRRAVVAGLLLLALARAGPILPVVHRPTIPALNTHGVLISDGGLATELECRGANLADHLWSARLLRDDPRLIYDAHLQYFLAGADFATSASYQATIAGFERAGVDTKEAGMLIRKSVRLAVEARDAAWKQIQADPNSASRIRPLVAASVGSYGASLADGSEYRGDYNVTLEELKIFHRRRLLLLADERPDVFACETVPCLLEVEALLQLLDEPEVRAKDIPAWIAVSCRDESSLNSGESLAALAALVSTYLDKRPGAISALGINCTPPQHLECALGCLATHLPPSLPLIVYANKGEQYDPDQKEWIAGTAASDQEYVEHAKRWVGVEGGGRVKIVGGCCRTTPSTITALRQHLVSSSEKHL